MRWPRLHAHYYPRACYWYPLRVGGRWHGRRGATVWIRIGWRLWTLSVTVPA